MLPNRPGAPAVFLIHHIHELIHGAALVLDLEGEQMLIEQIVPKVNVLGKICLDSVELFCRARVGVGSQLEFPEAEDVDARVPFHQFRRAQGTSKEG